MDFRKLSTFILAFGIALFAFGAFQYASNRPVNMKETDNPFQDMANAFSSIGKNIGRAEKREDARTMMIAGGVIAFAGVAVRYSAKKG